jgi:hypothetical protein
MHEFGIKAPQRWVYMGAYLDAGRGVRTLVTRLCQVDGMAEYVLYLVRHPVQVAFCGTH